MGKKRYLTLKQTVLDRIRNNLRLEFRITSRYVYAIMADKVIFEIASYIHLISTKFRWIYFLLCISASATLSVDKPI